MRRLRAFLMRSDGIALPVAAGALLMVSLLAGALASTAIQTSKDSNTERSSKHALSAAEAGLHLATYRLNQLKPLATECLRSHTSPSQYKSPASGGECPLGVVEQLGNGATYSFVVARAGGVCGSLPGASAFTVAFARCVTSIGTVHGVTRRVQTNVVPAEHYPFKDAGAIGLDLVRMQNSVAITNTDVGTNGQVVIGPGTTSGSGAIALSQGPPAATSTGNASGFAGGIKSVAPFTAPQIDFTATRTSSGGTNNNASLSTNPSYNVGTRVLRLSNGAVVTLAAGTYNFCMVELVNSNQLRIPADGTVKIFIDSPADPLSGCAAGTGRFVAHNSSRINETAGNPANLDVYVAGSGADSTGTPDVLFDNSVWFRGSIVAPNSTVTLANSVTLQAAVIAKQVFMSNSATFIFPDALRNRPHGIGGAFAREAWFECRPEAPVASDPESGC